MCVPALTLWLDPLLDLYLSLHTQDNMLVLTATIRCQMFKEKCFTSLLYKQL